MSKKKIAGIIVGCIVAIIVVIFITTHLPEKPEQIAVSAYNFSEQLFDPQLTSLQRDSLWKEYEGKQVKWISELKEVVSGKEGPVAHFLNPLDWERTEIRAVFDESQRSNLSQCKEGDLVTYTGILSSLGEYEISLTDCAFVSLAIVPLWWNKDIDTSNKRILVEDEVLYLGASTYDDILESSLFSPGITAIDRETGDILWEQEIHYWALVGIDSRYVYASYSGWSQYWWGTWFWKCPCYITALNKASGQIALTSSLLGSADCLPFTRYPRASVSDCVDYWVSQINGAVNQTANESETGLILLVSRPPLSKLTYEYEGVIYKSACAVYGGIGTECGTLQAIDQETGDVLWMMTFQEVGMTDFSIDNGILYVSTDNGVGAFEPPNLTDLQN
jgi:hypothetical protein